jgi:hypothetical protein
MYVCTNLHSLVYTIVKSSSHERESGVLTNIHICQYYCSMYNVRYRVANVYTVLEHMMSSRPIYGLIIGPLN